MAVDKLHAERFAKCNSDDFRKGEVEATEQNPKLSDNAKTQQEELADMIGISVDTLNNYKKLTELVPELQDWVETGIQNFVP